MPSPLVKVSVLSCYPLGKTPKKRLEDIINKQTGIPIMAWLTEDSAADFQLLKQDVEALGGQLIISDMYRDKDMQNAAHNRWKAEYEAYCLRGKVGKAPKYSPPAGGSFHQAGRAIDIDLSAIKPLAKHDPDGNALKKFWELAKNRGWYPIIKAPKASASEAWHFDHPGPFLDLRRKSYRQGALAAIQDIVEPY
jgi:hypothetical protein